MFSLAYCAYKNSPNTRENSTLISSTPSRGSLQSILNFSVQFTVLQLGVGTLIHLEWLIKTYRSISTEDNDYVNCSFGFTLELCEVILSRYA